MFDERDFIARQFDIEEQLAEAAHERLLYQVVRERQSCEARRDTQRTGVWAAILMWSGHLLIRAGQRLETLASVEPLFGTSATEQ